MMSISCQQIGCNGLMSPNDGCFVQGYNWAKCYKCNSCNGVRYMCDLCINSDNAMVRRALHHRSRLCRHHRLYHDDSVRPRKIMKVDEIGSIVKDPMPHKKSSPSEKSRIKYCKIILHLSQSLSYFQFLKMN